MKAFKLFYKIFYKSALKSMIIYFIIFCGLAVLISNVSTQKSPTEFNAEKCKVLIMDEDNSMLSNALGDYIYSKSEKADVDLSRGDEIVKDALFFRQAEYVLTIPKGFGENFLGENPLELNAVGLENSASSTYLDMMINAYLSTFKAYSSAGELSFEEVASATNSDLKNGIDVEKSSATTSSIHESINRFFNFLSYPIMCILILGLSIVSISLNQSDVRRRNLASPMNQLKFNLSIFGATMLLAIATWALLCLLSLANFGGSLLETLHIYHIINMFVFTLVAVSLSFLIGQVATLGSINPIANVISLGFCFLGGAFVPQELLTGAAGKIALIDPAHWYIKANIFVTTLSEFSFDNLMPYFKYLGIELLFAVVFLAVGLVVSKYKNAEKLA